MIKYIFHIAVITIFISSCREININNELKNTVILDSLLVLQQTEMRAIDSTKLLSYIEKASRRVYLFESENLNPFQKQWLHHDKLAYEEIYLSLKRIHEKIDSTHLAYEYSKQQIQALKEDLLHRHLNKKDFKGYFTDEQKILAELKEQSDNLNKSFTKHQHKLDSLEFKLQGVLTQLDAIDSRDEESAKN